MQKHNKYFAEQLNKCLDDLGMPASPRERATNLSKMLDIPKQQAWSFVEGQQIPDNDLLERIATELEVEVDWLLGKVK